MFHNQVDGLQDVGIWESEPRAAQGFNPLVCFADALMDDVAWIGKRTYSDDNTNEMATRDHPFWYEISKEVGLTGDDFRYGMHTGNVQSISGTLTDAQSAANGNSGVIKGEQFACEPTLKYGVLKMDRPSMMRYRLKGKGAFYDWFTKQVSSMIEEFGARLAFDAYGDGNGIRGRRASVSGNIITLSGTRTADKFKRGMVLGASANSDGSSPRTGTTFVTKIDRANNKITVDDVTDISGFIDNDYLFVSGEPGTCIEGMGLCTPLAAPTSGTLFRGVERTNDLEALAGSRLDTSGYVEDVIGDLAVEVNILNHRLTRAKCHPKQFKKAADRLGAKVTYTTPGKNADIGFETLKIHVAGGMLELMSDPDCPYTVTRAYNERSHKIVYVADGNTKPIYWIKNGSGGDSQWSATSDGIEMRCNFYGNYIQPDTSEHAVGSVSE